MEYTQTGSFFVCCSRKKQENTKENDMGTINKKLKDISPIAVEAEAGNAGRVVYDLKTGVLKLEKELVSLPGLNIQEVEICPWALREGAILRWLDQFGRTRLGF